MGVDLRLTEIDVWKYEREFFELYNNGPTVDLANFQISGSFDKTFFDRTSFESQTYGLFTTNPHAFVTLTDPRPFVAEINSNVENETVKILY